MAWGKKGLQKKRVQENLQVLKAILLQVEVQVISVEVQMFISASKQKRK